MKRTIAQFAFFLITNFHLSGFLTGTIYRGPLKNACVPGLACYSCPGALGACPIGALQAVVGSAKYQFPFYVAGTLALFGITLGRLICGWLCPFGLVQDLLYRVKVRKRALPKGIDRALRYLKYVILVLLVILFPMLWLSDYGISIPYFCQYLCPSGTLFGGIPLLAANPPLRAAAGWLFSWKFGLLVLFLAGSLFLFRPFCKYFCPLGAIYAWFNRISIVGMSVNQERCTRCGKCEAVCPMQVPVQKNINHGECIRCGTCKNQCPASAITYTRGPETKVRYRKTREEYSR